MLLKDLKAPPTLWKDTLYINLKKKIRLWEALTLVPEEKRAPTIFKILTGEAREAILNMEIEALTAKTSVKKLIDES